MRGLILKDFYSIGKSGRVLLPMILFFFIMSFAAGNTSFATGFVMVMMMLLPITSMSYDAASKWDIYAVSLPIGRTKIVLAKYLFLLILMVLAVLLITVYSLIVWAIGMKGFSVEDTKLTVLLCTGGGLFVSTILLPLVYKFGVEKSRYMMFGIFMLPYLLVIIGKQLPLSFHPDFSWIVTHQGLVVFLVILALAALFMLSLALSASFYRKKDF